MERYKIGTISKLLQIPVDTLRFYENAGLITPKKDAANGYRYYDVTDIADLLEYQRLRKMGFSGKNAQTLVQGATLTDYVTDMEKREQELGEQILATRRLNEYQEDYLRRLKLIGKDLYRFRITTMPEFYYFISRSEHRFAPVSDVEPLMEEWIQYAPFAEDFCRIKIEEIETEERPLKYCYGMSIAKKWAVRLSVNTTAEHIHFVKEQMAVRVVVGMRDTIIERATLQEGLQYIQDHRFTPNGPVLGRVLARVFTPEGDKVQYTELYFPIRE